MKAIQYLIAAALIAAASTSCQQREGELTKAANQRDQAIAEARAIFGQ